MVNQKPLVPGHVLVCPTRVVQHLRDLTELETLDLFVCAKEITKKFEDTYTVRSYSLILQDGDHAGQAVKHVHLHIIPRDEKLGGPKELQFQDDGRYDRTQSEMAEEAE